MFVDRKLIWDNRRGAGPGEKEGWGN